MLEQNRFSLLDQIIVSMPSMQDSFFNRCIIYICEHTPEGAIGLILNKKMKTDIFSIFDQMKINYEKEKVKNFPVIIGGPLQPERGFILHNPCGNWKSSLQANKEYIITTSKDILEAIAVGKGPDQALIILGYCGWDGEQLTQEILENSWVNCTANKELIFNIPIEQRWQESLKMIGISHSNIQLISGHA
ncbi:MAG: YqgE/AlgH family protein [Legionellales bacterium]|nr:YqgE/AlgH family protein [Legionellales bacterium]